MRPIAYALALGLLAAPALQAAETYAFDPGHTQVRASWNHAGFSEQALHFREVNGSAAIDLEDPSATKLNVVISIAGIDPGVSKFRDHLLGSDFFDTEKFPEATFVSTAVEKTGDTTLKVTGDLTIKGISKPVTLDVVVNNQGAHPLGQFVDYYKGEWVGVTATGQITRSDWGLGYGAPLTSDEVDLFISVEMKAGS